MAIIHKKYATGYTKISNTIAQDKTLSLQAKGLFLYLWSLPENWNFYVEEISMHATNGRDATRRAIKELEEHKYLTRVNRRNKGTERFEGMNWYLDDETKAIDNNRQTENASDGKIRQTENTSDGKMHTINKTNTNKINNTNKENIKENGQHTDVDPYIAKKIIDYLNQKAGTKYKTSSKKTQVLIKARMHDGFKLDDFKKVIDNKINDWLGDKVMGKYLRPETLFSNKFEGYLNQKSNSNHGASYEQFNMQSLQAPPIEDMDDDDLPF